ncbi:MAG: N-acetyltransferase [Pseudomonadota bacterium]|nr:MAG: N-acetyltransferase [Pseudomonadota bacterium]
MSDTSLPQIRPEQASDIAAIHQVNELAFGQAIEADLVDELRRECPEFHSWVAVVDERVVGHILFTPAILETGDQVLYGMALAPVAVLPEFQKQGIGAALIEAGIAHLDAAACPFLIVLGHPAYYPRFGFIPADEFEIRCQWEVPEEAFMMRFPGVPPANLRGGVAFYRKEFDTAV